MDGLLLFFFLSLGDVFGVSPLAVFSAFGAGVAFEAGGCCHGHSPKEKAKTKPKAKSEAKDAQDSAPVLPDKKKPKEKAKPSRVREDLGVCWIGFRGWFHNISCWVQRFRAIQAKS